MSKNVPKTVRDYMAEIGRRGGKSRSPKKLLAVQKNLPKRGKNRNGE